MKRPVSAEVWYQSSLFTKSKGILLIKKKKKILENENPKVRILKLCLLE